MAKISELFVGLIVFVLGATNVIARTYIVGDNMGWSTPSNGATFYSNWANPYKFVPGDILVFNFFSGHTVARVNNKNDYDSCNTGNSLSTLTNSPVTVPLNSTGVYYFFCTVHCIQGQKLTVNVGSTNGPPSPPPPPGSNPFPGFNNSSPPPPPPPPSAATSAAHFSGLIFLPILLFPVL